MGADGPTHSGSFDVTYMACLPNMVVMAPSDEAELFHMVATAAAITDRPSCFRYPRGNGIGVPLPPANKGVPLEVHAMQTDLGLGFLQEKHDNDGNDDGGGDDEGRNLEY